MRLAAFMVLFLNVCFPTLIPKKGYTSPWEAASGFPLDQVIKEVLLKTTSSQNQLSCSFLFFLDDKEWHADITKRLGDDSFGWGAFILPFTEDSNETLSLMDDLISKGRKLRKLMWCPRVVVIIREADRLSTFADSSRKNRLLSWPIQLLVVTSLSYPNLLKLMRESWTLTMMNAMLINFEDPGRSVGIYTNMPYTADGPKSFRLASMMSGAKIVFHSNHRFFPDKHSNFYGGEFKATSGTWEPNWKEWEEDAPNGTKIMKYSGSEYLILVTLSEALNFTIHIVKSQTWRQALKLVELKEVDAVSIYHLLLPQRMPRFDFTYSFEYAFTSFAMRKPELKPQWQSLHYPFQENVWLALLLIIVFMPTVTFLVISVHNRNNATVTHGWSVTMEIIRTLFAQDISPWVPSGHSVRLLFATWLFFVFLVAMAYKGNLTAALTLPRYPQRADTIEALVDTVDKTTMESSVVKNIFRGLSSPVSQKFSDLIDPTVSVIDGLRQAAVKSQAHMASRRHLQFLLAKHYTEADGSCKMYIGRETVVPGLAGWPITHDAPYKQHFDWLIMAIIEAGLFEKWNVDFMADTVSESRRIKKKMKIRPDSEEMEEGNSELKALTLVHMQGPIMLYCIVLVLAAFSFTAELVIHATL